MKHYLTGFGIIMAIGFSFALLGSNAASGMLAAVLDQNSANLTSTSVGTTTDEIATTTTPEGTTTPATIKPLTAPPVTRAVSLSGLTANQQIHDVHILTAYANDRPITVTFVLKDQNNNEHPFAADCAIYPTAQTSYVKCVKEFGTKTVPNGKYSISARATYADEAIVSSGQVSVYVYNNEKPPFRFLAMPSVVSGIITIEGTIGDTNSEIEFLYITEGMTQPTRIGNGIFAGGLNASKWFYEWDTNLVPNGTYKIIASARNYSTKVGPYHAGNIIVAVRNGENVQPPYATIIPLTYDTPTTTETPSPVPDQTVSPIDDGADTPTTTEPSPEPIEKPSSVIDSRTVPPTAPIKRDTVTQPIQRPSVAPVSPIVQQIQNIAIGFQGNERDSVEAARKLDALQKELWKGMNPTSPTVQARTRYQSAKDFGATVDATVMRVGNVTLSTTTIDTVVSVATTTVKGERVTVKETKKVTKQKVKLSGKALPNMYVTIYIYSEIPTIAVVKTDRNGNWIYELDNKLDDGQHEAYVTINDNTGKVVAKSDRFAFVKTAEAVTVERVGLATVEASADEPIEPAQAAKGKYAMVVFMIIGAGLLIGVFIIVHSFKS